MLHRFRAPSAPAIAEVEPRPAAGARLSEPAARHKKELESALSGVRDERWRKEIFGSIDEAESALKLSGTAAPPPGPPDHVALRVVGVDEKKKIVPLGHLRVRFAAGNQKLEATTDGTGYALFEAERPGSFTIEALSPAGDVVGRLEGTIEPGKSAALKMELGYSLALAPSFAHGASWADAVSKATDRLKELRKSTEGLINERRKELETSIARIDAPVREPERDNPPWLMEIPGARREHR